MIANYHTHTWRCGHAGGTEEEYIQAAIKSGIKTLGFSDHVPYRFWDDFNPGVRMKTSLTKDYVDTITALRDKYKDQIQIFVGYEAEYFKPYFDECLDSLNQYECDYLILGQHYHVGDSVNLMYNGVPTEDFDAVKNYVNDSLEALQTGKFLYMAHPDLINYVGDKHDEYKSWMREICLLAKDLGLPLEWNILGMRTNRNYPGDTFFELAAEVGNKIIIGVDAHDPEALCNTASFEEASRKVKSFGLEIVDSLEITDFNQAK